MPLVTCADCNNQVSDRAATCPKCGAPVEKPPPFRPKDPDVEIRCPHCGSRETTASAKCLSCGRPLQPTRGTAGAEQVLLETRPAMFAHAPIAFVLTLLLVFFYGLGLLIFLIWYMRVSSYGLTITTTRTVLREGLLSKRTSEVFHRDIRNVQVSQAMTERLFNTGSLGISSAGQSGVEISIAGIHDPYGAKALIDQHR